MEMSAL